MYERDEIKTQFKELSAQIKALSQKQDAQYTDVVLQLKRIDDRLEGAQAGVVDDELYESAKEAVIKARKASTPSCSGH